MQLFGLEKSSIKSSCRTDRRVYKEVTLSLRDSMKKEAAAVASLPEVLKTFGLSDLTDVTSVLVKLGYHEGRSLLKSSKKGDRQRGRTLMRQIARSCEELSKLYTTLGYSVPAFRAIEIAGTCWGHAGYLDREEGIAHRELSRLLTLDIEQLSVAVLIAKIEVLSYSMSDDMAILTLQVLAKSLKYRTVSPSERKHVLQTFMVHDHPDTIGRWLWAVEVLATEDAFNLGQRLKERTETLQPYTKSHTWQAFENKMEELVAGL